MDTSIFESQEEAAAAVAERVGALAVAAEDLKKSAASLLDKAALAHVIPRGACSGCCKSND